MWGETWQTLARPHYPSYHHYHWENRHHVPPYMRHYDVPSLVLLPKIHNLNLLMRKPQINTHRGMFYKIIGLYSLITSRSWETKTDWEKLPEKGDWSDKTTKEKVVLWHDLVNWCNLYMDCESNKIIIILLCQGCISWFWSLYCTLRCTHISEFPCSYETDTDIFSNHYDASVPHSQMILPEK